MDRDEDLRRNTELLDKELPSPRFRDIGYLRWLYDENPLGAAFEASPDVDGVRAAHYALIPQRYRDERGVEPMVFSLNAVTRSGHQKRGQGWFTKNGRKVYAEAAASGIVGVVGVSNANSTPAVVNKLGWRLVGPLPVKVAVPLRLRPRGWESHVVDDAFLASERFATVAAELDRQPATHWTNCYTPDYLRWRLRAVNGPGFSFHIGPDLVAVSTASHAGPLPVAVILKVLPRTATPVEHRPAGDVVAVACRHHRAVAAVHAGWNRWARFRGVRPPRRLQPSPLNLIYKGLSERAPQDTFALDTFEFLDMDAY